MSMQLTVHMPRKGNMVLTIPNNAQPPSIEYPQSLEDAVLALCGTPVGPEHDRLADEVLRMIAEMKESSNG